MAMWTILAVSLYNVNLDLSIISPSRIDCDALENDTTNRHNQSQIELTLFKKTFNNDRFELSKSNIELTERPREPCSFHYNASYSSGAGPTDYFLFCQSNMSIGQKCRNMAKEMNSCDVRKFGCDVDQNSLRSPFRCPSWSAWNEWSECQYQHSCSPNKTKVI